MTYAYTKQDEEELRRRQALAHLKRMEEINQKHQDFVSSLEEPDFDKIKDVTPKNQKIEE